jgi:hypothetical protein
MAAPHFTCFPRHKGAVVVGKVGLQLVGGTGRPSGSVRYGRGTGAFWPQVWKGGQVWTEGGRWCDDGLQRRSVGVVVGLVGSRGRRERGGGDYNLPPKFIGTLFAKISTDKLNLSGC